METIFYCRNRDFRLTSSNNNKIRIQWFGFASGLDLTGGFDGSFSTNRVRNSLERINARRTHHRRQMEMKLPLGKSVLVCGRHCSSAQMVVNHERTKQNTQKCRIWNRWNFNCVSFRREIRLESAEMKYSPLLPFSTKRDSFDTTDNRAIANETRQLPLLQHCHCQI